MKQTIVIGITGSIAAYKIIDLIPLLTKEGINVEIIMTHCATRMVAKKDIESILGKKVHDSLFKNSSKSLHIGLAKSGDLFVIAPSTANTIAKLAHGLADNLLTTTTLATNSPIIICPAMNTIMWNNPATQENVQKLKQRRVNFLGPEKGNLACGDIGVGRLVDINDIKKQALNILKKRKSLSGKKIIVTAGGTVEPIDNVRVITNRSSGKMGTAIAQECFLRGADVAFLRANSSVAPKVFIQEEIFETSDQLYALIKKHAKDADAIFHVAAVSDFAPKTHFSGKLDSHNSYNIKLVPQRKIINEIKKINPKIFVVAFKAVYKKEGEKMVKIAKEKLDTGAIDVVVVNDIGKKNCGFSVDTNEVIVVQKNKKVAKATFDVVKIPLTSKKEVARELVKLLL